MTLLVGQTTDATPLRVLFSVHSVYSRIVALSAESERDNLTTSRFRSLHPSGDSGINLDYSRSLQSSEVWKEIYKQDDNGDTLLHLRLAAADCVDRESLSDVLLEYLRATPHPDFLEIVNDWGQVSIRRKFGSTVTR